MSPQSHRTTGGRELGQLGHGSFPQEPVTEATQHVTRASAALSPEVTTKALCPDHTDTSRHWPSYLHLMAKPALPR